MRDCGENGHHPATQKIVVCKYILTYNAEVKKRATAKYERRASEVRQKQIVDAATRIIATRGSRRFTAELLGAEVGITGGAIFRHFESMDAIVDAVVDRMETILFDGFPPKATDPIERLGEFFRHRVRAIVSHPDMPRLLLSDHLAQTGSPTHARRVEAFRRRTRSFVFQCLSEARDSGILNGEVEPEEGTILVAGSILALAHAKVRAPRSGEIGQLAHKVWKTLETLFRRKNQAAVRTHTPRQAAGQARPTPIGNLE
jgi:TetR/AcrR family transcriptional regulator